MKDLIIAGAGGFGRELLQVIKDINKIEPRWNIKGFIDDIPDALDGYECDYRIIGSIKEWQPGSNEVFTCAVGDPIGRKKVVDILKNRGATFVPIIHPTAQIYDYSRVGEGLIMYPQSVISANAEIGDYCVVLFTSGCAHDTNIGDYCTISSFCDVTGGVQMGNNVYLGSRVTIIPKRKIGEGAFIGAGSVVMTNVKAGARVMGNPARKMDF